MRFSACKRAGRFTGARTEVYLLVGVRRFDSGRLLKLNFYTMKWQFVFNTDLKPYWNTISEAAEAARQGGYRFMHWGGKILTTSDLEETGINYEDLI